LFAEAAFAASFTDKGFETERIRMSKIYDITVNSIDGKPQKLADYAGKVLLVVNVASKCGLTPQYESLEKAYEQYRDKGLVVLGFPCNQFGAQEPGSEAEIQDFCISNFGVKFPMFSKLDVNGDTRHPLYQSLIAAQPKGVAGAGLREKLAGYGIKIEKDSDILWNFEKFLINRNGDVVARFDPDIAVDDPKLLQAIEKQLAA
jgi:glutathione peroxidase